jgi:hypothetical protein
MLIIGGILALVMVFGLVLARSASLSDADPERMPPGARREGEE